MTTPKPANEPVAAYLPLPDKVKGDIQGSLAAIRRAAQRARRVAQQTGTDLIVERGGQIVRVAPDAKQ